MSTESKDKFVLKCCCYIASGNKLPHEFRILVLNSVELPLQIQFWLACLYLRVDVAACSGYLYIDEKFVAINSLLSYNGNDCILFILCKTMDKICNVSFGEVQSINCSSVSTLSFLQSSTRMAFWNKLPSYVGFSYQNKMIDEKSFSSLLSKDIIPVSVNAIFRDNEWNINVLFNADSFQISVLAFTDVEMIFDMIFESLDVRHQKCKDEFYFLNSRLERIEDCGDIYNDAIIITKLPKKKRLISVRFGSHFDLNYPLYHIVVDELVVDSNLFKSMLLRLFSLEFMSNNMIETFAESKANEVDLDSCALYGSNWQQVQQWDEIPLSQELFLLYQPKMIFLPLELVVEYKEFKYNAVIDFQHQSYSFCSGNSSDNPYDRGNRTICHMSQFCPMLSNKPYHILDSNGKTSLCPRCQQAFVRTDYLNVARSIQSRHLQKAFDYFRNLVDIGVNYHLFELRDPEKILSLEELACRELSSKWYFMSDEAITLRAVMLECLYFTVSWKSDKTEKKYNHTISFSESWLINKSDGAEFLIWKHVRDAACAEFQINPLEYLVLAGDHTDKFPIINGVGIFDTIVNLYKTKTKAEILCEVVKVNPEKMVNLEKCLQSYYLLENPLIRYLCEKHGSHEIGGILSNLKDTAKLAKDPMQMGILDACVRISVNFEAIRQVLLGNYPDFNSAISKLKSLCASSSGY